MLVTQLGRAIGLNPPRNAVLLAWVTEMFNWWPMKPVSNCARNPTSPVRPWISCGWMASVLVACPVGLVIR